MAGEDGCVCYWVVAGEIREPKNYADKIIGTGLIGGTGLRCCWPLARHSFRRESSKTLRVVTADQLCLRWAPYGTRLMCFATDTGTASPVEVTVYFRLFGFF